MTDNILLELTRLERAAFETVRRRLAEQQLGELFNNEETDNEEATDGERDARSCDNCSSR